MLKVSNLKVSFKVRKELINAVKGISFEVKKGEIVCLVGESGSGKSVSCYSVLKLLPRNAIVSGEISFENIDNLLTLSEKEIRNIRGNKISMVFQEPSAVLNPLLTVGEQIVETILAHQNISKEEAKNLAIKSMEEVNIPEPQKRFNQYPHELSGGLKQRVAIAIAVVNNPKILLADEPTTALDVTVSAKILELFVKLKEKGVGILLITHDLGVVAQVADRVYLMHKGEILEHSNVFEFFENPNTEYAKKLLKSRPIYI
ncbi:MAG TPA: ABC transporter ATP-binding protein [Hydrogenothermaceae bacterium]|nr:ABC transporter ATP-binding protein [Hydrogenothermaceae bacterium]